MTDTRIKVGLSCSTEDCNCREEGYTVEYGVKGSPFQTIRVCEYVMVDVGDDTYVNAGEVCHALGISREEFHKRYNSFLPEKGYQAP